MKNGHGPGEGSKHQQQIAASLIAITPIYRSRIEENGDPDEAEQSFSFRKRSPSSRMARVRPKAASYKPGWTSGSAHGGTARLMMTRKAAICRKPTLTMTGRSVRFSNSSDLSARAPQTA